MDFEESQMEGRKPPADDHVEEVLLQEDGLIPVSYTHLDVYKRQSFEIIAFYAMRSAIGHEYEKQRRRIQTISLDAEIPNTNHLTYQDLISNPENSD